MGGSPNQQPHTKFSRLIRNQVAELIRLHGRKEAHRLSPVPMSFGTVTRIAKEYGIDLLGLKQETLRKLRERGHE